MHRLFAGFRLPAAVIARLAPLMGGVPGARWQDEDQLHLTLRFIGEVDRHMAEDIALALGQVRHPPIQAALSSVGQFGSRGRVTALWAGVRPHDALASLHRKVDQALVRLRLAPEGRAYLPHVTLARLNVPLAAAEPFLRNHAALAGPPFTLDRFTLFESHLGHARASYTAVAEYPQGGGHGPLAFVSAQV